MSLIKANAVQVGQSPTATQNFTLAVPSSPDGTIKLARGNFGATTQDVISVDASGNVSFAGTTALGNISNSTAIATGSTTARSLANRFADTANVRDFGAVGDGVTNDIAAFVLAADTGKQVLVPDGTYTITTSTLVQVNSILSMLSRLHLFCNQLTINIGSGQFNIPLQTELNVTNPDRLIISGANPIATTITTISNVTGSAGSWSVTANVNSSTGIAIGDLVTVKNVKPGVQAPGTYTTRPVKGALQMQFFQNGELTLASTSGSVTGSTLSTYVNAGDFLIADGQVKRMLSVTTNSFAVDAANTPATNFAGKQYWYTMQDSSFGTVTVSGATVTGTGTAFTNITNGANAGDLIAFNGGGIRKIQSVTSDTSITLTETHPTIAVAATYGIVCSGEIHEGAWVVTNVAANQITWTNTSRTTYAPPKNLVVGGDITALKSVLQYTTNSGFVVDGGVYEFENIGLVGTNGTTNVGLDLRGESGEGTGNVIISNNFAVNGFDYGAWLSSGATIQGNGSVFSGQFVRGINAAGGECRLESSIISGVGGIGILISEGAFARLSNARIHTCSAQGVRMEVGGSTWADFSIIGHNQSYNVLLVGAVNAHFVGLRCFSSNADGFYGQNGGYGRATGAIYLCNNGDGLALYQANMECNQTIAIGNKDSGCLLGRSNCALEQSAFGYNVLRGLYLVSMANVNAITTNQYVGNATGVLVSARSVLYSPLCGFKNNTNDATAAEGGQIYIKNQTGGSAFNPALDVAPTNVGGEFIATLY
jgi:hypothetical protein